MIDAKNVTNFKLNKYQLEEVILFWVCAAGKNGVTAARCLDNLLQSWKKRTQVLTLRPTPFQIVKHIDLVADLPLEMKKVGIGCYNNKSKTFLALANSNLNLKTCSVGDLEAIPGIGHKTARCFLIHSRENQKYAGLDTHILKFLRDKGHKVPKSTPSGKKYKELEQIFLKYVESSGKSVAELDLSIWNLYRSKGRS